MKPQLHRLLSLDRVATSGLVARWCECIECRVASGTYRYGDLAPTHLNSIPLHRIALLQVAFTLLVGTAVTRW